MIRRVAIVAVLLLVLVALTAWLLAGRPPAWWMPPTPDDPQAIALAENLERRLTEEVTRVRTDQDPWAIRLGEDQANAWLALRMPRWIEHAGERIPAEVQVRFLAGSMEIGVRPRAAGEATATGTIGVLRLRPVLESGVLSVQPLSASIGSLWVPGAGREMVLSSAEAILRAMTRASAEAERSAGSGGESAGEEPAGEDHDAAVAVLRAVLGGAGTPARWSLGDGREVLLLDLEIVPGALIAQCTTVWTPRE